MKITTPALYTKTGKHKGQKYESSLYRLDDYEDLSQLDVVRAVCFSDLDKVVFYKDINGCLGTPGGGTEKGETAEETLRRELVEEAQLKLLSWRTIGYEKIEYFQDGALVNTLYFLLTVTKVSLINNKVSDPDGKAVGRVLVDLGKAVETLGWGEKGAVLIKLAEARLFELF